MQVKITNVYTNKGQKELHLKGAWGNSFLIEYPDDKILFDLGWKGKIFLQNLTHLGHSPNEISSVVFSHGHRDHTGSLPLFLKNRTITKPLSIYGHPSMTEPKKQKILGPIQLNMTYPNMDQIDPNKYQVHLNTDPVEIHDKLWTTGEILKRKEKDGTKKGLIHKINNTWKRDPLLDDLSLILEAKEGLIIIGGCMHAGLLNTIEHVHDQFKASGKKISTIIGGTHLFTSSPEDIDAIMQKIENKYQIEHFYLNHCTGTNAQTKFKEKFGSERVSSCPVGTQLSFEI
ncbi:7,8-dihydropterin-6-methyl-4-(beta-D-ribofuranosyl)-aminobenzene-5'-phosphate synthase [Candidatus Lokiarchaeum ossiferum]|uniref:7, 8-dihydropterin-6-methyl-4-(Beta-D-ribofuranosyl)-aminobenzene-5'-phosphate synthase n=1 Tax=Candidatus Lokiarchaeum ossiferum TaxID=2951803 RepID=A0ABY6HPT6_9ARCH|nr:7,8-dihydropterin-6-methyl-4-(beta-D-ribofuranosyl)-aminobenzene-5'-phosphate synthase [Candidatus Lokiarchaeum sp. B-35]